MKDPFEISHSALIELFDSFYDFNLNSELEEAVSIPETKGNQIATKKITLLFTGLKSLNQQEREFIRKVLAAIGIKGKETTAHFGANFDQTIEDSLRENQSRYLFLWGNGLSTVKGEFYSNQPFGDSQLLILKDLKTTMAQVEEKKKLWALLQSLTF